MVTKTTITSYTAGSTVTVANFKNFGRVPDISSEDTQIQSMINAASMFIMQHTGVVFDANITIDYDATEIDKEDYGAKMVLELPIIGSGLTVSSAEKYDDEYTASDWDYTLMRNGRLSGDVEKELTVTYTVSNTDMPDPIRQAILLKTLELYDNRGTQMISPQIAMLVAPYRRRSFIG